jgi:hypothetical protein
MAVKNAQRPGDWAWPLGRSRFAQHMRNGYAVVAAAALLLLASF